MPVQNSEEAGTRVPYSVVFITIGFILLLTVLAVWVVAPSWMPTPLYLAVNPYLGEYDGVGILPTRVPLAAVPERQATATPGVTEILVPETAVATPTPQGLVNAQEIAKRDPWQGMPVRMEIPAIGLETAVREVGLTSVTAGDETYYQWEVPDAYEAGWHFNSALLGEAGNTVFNGHHNINGEVFRDLIDLELGDTIVLYDRYQAYTYTIFAIEILAERDQPLDVRLENAQWILPTTDERITLITCWPYTDNSHRLVVVAEPADESRASADENSN